MTGEAPARERLLAADLPDATTVVRCESHRITLAPGQAPGAHRHPCHVVGLVTSGRIRYELAGGAEIVLEAGSAFHEPQGALVLRFDNDSSVEPATFVATYLLEAEDQQLIVMEA